MAKEPQFLKPRLRLFLSADIIGSTALKQSARATLPGLPSEDWFPVLQGFYIETQRAFLDGWDRAAIGAKKDILWGPRPELWKVIGDEILFTKELTDHHQLHQTLLCWVQAIEATRRFVRKVDGRLDIKCTAWTAGFPVMNKEVALPRNFDPESAPVTDYFKEAGRLLDQRYRSKSDAKIAVDYIGPSIDIGFRLAQFASARKFIVSVGVAYILTMSNKRVGPEKLGAIRYDGSIALKGVFGGAKYPIFWVDLSQEGDLARLEDELIPPKEYKPDAVHAYCARFFSDAKAYTFPPFIESKSEGELLEQPEFYEAALAQLRESYALNIIGDKKSERQAEAEVPPPDTSPVIPDKPAILAQPASPEAPRAVRTIDFVSIFDEVVKLDAAIKNLSRSGRPTEEDLEKRDRPRTVGKNKKSPDGKKD